MAALRLVVAVAAVLACARAQVLFAGGDFTTTGSTTLNSFTYNVGGNTWTATAGGVNDEVRAIARYRNAIYVGGYFTQAAGKSAAFLAIWDGAAWSPLPSGPGSSVRALAVLDDVLYVGGLFTTVGGVSARYFAAWNGRGWLADTERVSNYVYTMCVFRGAVYAGGDFTTIQSGSEYIPSPYLAAYNGSKWSAVFGQAMPVVSCVVYNDRLYLGGTATSPTRGAVSVFDGVTVSTVGANFTGGNSNAGIYGLFVYRDVLIAGGRFTTAGTLVCNYIASWDGSTWRPIGNGTGMNDWVYAFAERDGVLIVGGDFTTAFGVSASRVVSYDGVSWYSAPSGVNGIGVYTLAYLDAAIPTAAPATPTPSRAPTPAPPTVAPECSLAQFDWRAQYYEDDGVIVEDLLTFDAPVDGSFVQTVVAYDYQDCAQNSVVWTGDHYRPNSTSLLFTYTRCTPSGSGCLRCGVTGQEWAQIKFNGACDLFTLQVPSATDSRTYIAVETSQRPPVRDRNRT